MASTMDREKSEKSKVSNQVKHIPKDAQVIMSILKELGILDYEPRVINQLLEFTYRYVTCILDDAKVYANHGKKKTIDLEDVKLASQLLIDKSFTAPPTRDVLFDLARSKNSTPLPLIKPHCGLRLPPDRYCLSACNYKLRAATQLKKLKKPAVESLINRPFKSTTPNLLTPKTEKGVLKRANMSSSSLIPPPPTIQKSIAIPKPFIKFSTTPKINTGKSKSDDEIKMEMDGDDDDVGGIMGQKRKRDEEDDFEVV